jgi:hypothetical protein
LGALPLLNRSPADKFQWPKRSRSHDPADEDHGEDSRRILQDNRVPRVVRTWPKRLRHIPRHDDADAEGQSHGKRNPPVSWPWGCLRCVRHVALGSFFAACQSVQPPWRLGGWRTIFVQSTSVYSGRCLVSDVPAHAFCGTTPLIGECASFGQRT